MTYTFRPMDEANAWEILTWRYDPPYDIYNAASDEATEAAQLLLNPDNAYQVITDERGQLVGYCCFGLDARVPGGDYDAQALDVGLGMRPDLTGQGHGPAFFAAILDFARSAFKPRALRITVAAFNQRAIRVYEKAGFERVQTFRRNHDGMAFAVLVREATYNKRGGR